MSDGGYVRIYRRVLDHPAFRSHAEAMAFAYLVALAAWRPTKVRYKGREIVLQRGQLVMSVRDFARHMERSRQWAERFFERLKKRDSTRDRGRDMIETATETGVTIITICNYEEYQNSTADTGTVVELHPRQHRDSAGTQNKEENKGKEGKKNNKGPDLPEWVPSEAWNGWLAMRVKIRKPATDRAQQLAIGKLEAMRKKGIDPGAVLDQSTLNGWQDLYEPKPGAKGAAREPFLI